MLKIFLLELFFILFIRFGVCKTGGFEVSWTCSGDVGRASLKFEGWMLESLFGPELRPKFRFVV